MKKNKLDISYTFDFEMVGIVCNQKEYKLAWHINSLLDIDLVKQDDIKLEFSNRSSILVSNLKYETAFVTIELLRNKLVSGSGNKPQFLIPELKQFDFLLKLKDETGERAIENVCEIVKEISMVEYVVKLNFEQLKSKENLLY